MQEFITHLISSHPYAVYAAVIILACVEGPVLSMIFGILVKLGIAGFWPAYIALMIGDLLGDTFWYTVGYFYGRPFISKYGRYFSVTEEGVARMEKIFRRYTEWILIISKLTTGFGFALGTLVAAGMAKIPFRKYIMLNGAGQFGWTGLLLGLGYFLGGTYAKFNSVLGKMGVVAGIIVVLAAIFGWGKYMKRRFEEKI